MKRKRKEHRSLDSILFEDDAELEYFDVLSLLPLSNVRLEYGGTDPARSGNFVQNTERAHGSRDLRALGYNELSSEREEASPTRSGNVTNEKKRELQEEDNLVRADDDSEKELRENLDSFRETNSRRQVSVEREHPEHRESNEIFEDPKISAGDRHGSSLPSKTDRDQRDSADIEDLVIACEEDRKLEEVEDYKSIWLSDHKDRGEMSRRPQILKVVDNDVTRRRHRRSVVEIDAIVEDVPKDKRPPEVTKSANERIDATLIKSTDLANQEDKVHEDNGTKVSKRGVVNDRDSSQFVTLKFPKD